MEPKILAGRVQAVRERIAAAQQRSGRTAPVTLVAVTKTHPPELVRAAREAGVGDVGENRAGELERKVNHVGRDGFRWHFIGHLQRNKVAQALPLFDLMHSVDSLRLARALSERAIGEGLKPRVLVQINAAGEASKYGFAAAGAVPMIRSICELPGVQVEGLMTMAPFTDDEALLRRTFRTAKELFDEAARDVPGFRPVQLSMGMSNDYEIAVEEGSTMVRIGSALFGERNND